MKVITWQDKNNWKRRSLLRENDPDDMAPMGVPAGPPNIEELDWESLIRELNNALVDREIDTWHDVQANQNAVSSAIISVFKRPIISLYRNQKVTEE